MGERVAFTHAATVVVRNVSLNIVKSVTDFIRFLINLFLTLINILFICYNYDIKKKD